MGADRSSTLWVVMIAVNRENRDSDIEITVLVIDCREAVKIAFENINCREERDSIAYE